jgi:hypothetical protein
MTQLATYLGTLRAGKIALWCYLIWYLTMAGFHFDARPALWINSVGISLVIGSGLVLSVLPPAGLKAMNKWALARLYLMPFGVSSFAALIKEQGFIVVFSPHARENLLAAAACALFVAVALTCAKLRRPAAP